MVRAQHPPPLVSGAVAPVVPEVRASVRHLTRRPGATETFQRDPAAVWGRLSPESVALPSPCPQGDLVTDSNASPQTPSTSTRLGRGCRRHPRRAPLVQAGRTAEANSPGAASAEQEAAGQPGASASH